MKSFPNIAWPGSLLILSGLALSGCRSQPPGPTQAPVPAAAVAPKPLSAVEKRAQLAAAVQIAPDDPAAYLNLALFDPAAGAVQRAEQELTELCERFPGV